MNNDALTPRLGPVSGQRPKLLEKVIPGAAKRFSEARQNIHSGISGAAFDALHVATINLHQFRQLFLGNPIQLTEPVNILSKHLPG